MAPLEPAVLPPAADDPGTTSSVLTTEQEWLQSWFRGTPVSITQDSDGAVNIEVPREFCFDAGSSRVKPPLAAVLDKTAESLRRVSEAQLALLAAPMDAGGTNALALRRAQQIRSYLRARGVPAARLGKPSTSTQEAVQLRIQVDPR